MDVIQIIGTSVIVRLDVLDVTMILVAYIYTLLGILKVLRWAVIKLLTAPNQKEG